MGDREGLRARLAARALALLSVAVLSFVQPHGAVAQELGQGPGRAGDARTVTGAEGQTTPQTMVALAQAGRWAEAEALARRVLDTAPEDVAALVVLARARRAAGDADGARAAAVRANDAARDDSERYVAAVEMAAASHAQGRGMEAQFWMRRAAQMAPTVASHDRALVDVQRIGAAMPWKVALQFNVSQSSNVNNGSLAESVDIGGLTFNLNPDAQALSGTEITAGVLARYRFAGAGGLPGQLTFNAATRQVRVSDEARAKAPAARSDDYAFGVLEVGVGQALTPADAALRFHLDGRLGKTWYGGEGLSRYMRLSGSADWGDPGTAVTAVVLSAERQLRLDDPAKTAWIAQGDLHYRWRSGAGDTYGLSFGLRRTESRSVEVDNDAVIASASWEKGHPLGGVASLGLGVSVEQRNYDASLYAAGARRDVVQRASLRIGLPKVDYYGFSPILRLESERLRSNVDFYDRSDVSFHLGLKTGF